MLRRPDRARARQPTAKFTDEIKFTITFNCKMKPAVRGPREPAAAAVPPVCAHALPSRCMLTPWCAQEDLVWKIVWVGSGASHLPRRVC